MTHNVIASMFHDYRMIDATDYFAAAFTWRSKPMPNDCVQLAIVPVDSMVDYLACDRESSSHGGGNVLRFKPNNTQKADMHNTWGTIELCTYGELCDTLDMLRKSAKNGEIMNAISGKPVNPRAINNGHAVEYLLCKRWGLTWEFDNASHTECGDISKNGFEYQVKFQGASL